MNRPRTLSQRGQTLVIFVLLLPVLLLSAGLVVDAGYGFSQQRTAQNAADFSAMAGTRVLGESLTGKPAGAGTDDNVKKAVDSVLSANHAQLVSAKYVDNTGNSLGNVGGGSIPSGAVGVTVNATTSWHTLFLGIMGVNSWSAGTTATAVTQGVSTAGVLPVGVSEPTFGLLPLCDPTHADFLTCIGTHGQDASAKIGTGSFGWLKFGAAGKCTGYGLGMINAGCQNSRAFLDQEIGPPSNSFGCCTDLTLTPDAQRLIGALTGNEVSKGLPNYIDPPVIVWVPIWDVYNPTGANANYHIVGYGGVVFTGQDVHGEWLQAVRVSTIGLTPNPKQLGATGLVQLVH
jgi:Flp pilus assembly protein TadG